MAFYSTLCTGPNNNKHLVVKVTSATIAGSFDFNGQYNGKVLITKSHT